ncbi:MAG: Asp/Glu racemase [Pseudomonadota bacterium]
MTQFGLIVLQADETLEDDMRRLMPRDVSCLVSRVPSATSVSSDNLRRMEDHLTAAAALLPRGAQFQGVAYGCTSGTAEIGADRIAERVRAGVQTPHVTEPVSALLAACRHLGATRIGLVSPYVASVSETLRDVLAANGVAVVSSFSFDEPVEAAVVRIPPEAIEAAVVDVAAAPECEAVFLSCTNLKTLGVIETIEAKIGRPVIASNQVLAWHLCALAGVFARDDAPGRLFGRAPQG